MAPETRSRGVPPPSRVYNSSPALQQVQFPARRKRIRRYAGSEQPSLKQQTLTQIEFVSSLGEDIQILSDSDEDALDGGGLASEDKENVKPRLADEPDQTAQEAEDGEDDDEEPIPTRRKRWASSTARQGEKRRRTMGDDAKRAVAPRKGDKSRRRTLGDVPTSSNYQTQTLTQFLGHQTSFVAGSDDDDLDLDEDHGDDGFLSWLGEPGSPSAGRGRRNDPSPSARRHHEAATAAAVCGADEVLSRENSVIPQTPAKRNTSIRFDLSSGGRQPPGQTMVDRYGAPDQQDSPLKNHSSSMQPHPVKLTGEPWRDSPGAARPPSLVIKDSYTTDDCTTPSKSQARILQSRSPTPLRASHHAPSILSPVGYEDMPTKKKGAQRGAEATLPEMLAAEELYEIPDSDEDDGEGEGEGEGENMEERYGAGIETQLVLSELASTEEKLGKSQDAMPRSARTSRRHTQPESAPLTVQYELQPTTPSEPTPPPPSNPIRKPIPHMSSRTQIQSQPWESQRVPVSILQSLPTPSARSDIIIPVSAASLEALTTGHTLHITAPFKVPSQVVRFWLFENNLLRYMASVEPAQQVQPAGSSSSSSSQGQWQYHATQVYELNNPVCEEDMREEAWLRGPITRYKYLPPAVIGQLLWNLRHAVFGEPLLEQQQQQQKQQVTSSLVHPSPQPQPQPQPPRGTDMDHARNQLPSVTPPGSMTVSQQISAQIHSDIASSTQFPTSDDMVPSTPDSNEPIKLPSSSTATTKTKTLPAPRAPRKPSRLVRPSQATTLSQPSTPGKQTQQRASNPSQSSVQFVESGSLGSLPFPSSSGSTSQLLTKSQMLPDSLIQDHAPPLQPEIWDSDDDNVSL
ncbi:uncharacterized protein MAM_02723 [Metarhizium album ARSEF 1941]|uniref:Uncharacterized protein n=1 Tax=Metarhizium album (strain ARSEF 1941) TaxID=1081103 RepID=A0A0B2X1P7_METAS|nr:uncharacterized protein MAM_02723 [Metarhizium album ARSEF 1941]KHN99025.1 hypothetical protein MAM_02723 [Metarhizium album ARSEF 1941]